MKTPTFLSPFAKPNQLIAAFLLSCCAILTSGCRRVEPTGEQLSTRALQSDVQSLAGDVQSLKGEQELLFEQLEAQVVTREQSAEGEKGMQQQLLTLSSKCANTDSQVLALNQQVRTQQLEQSAEIQRLRSDLLQLKKGVETMAKALASPTEASSSSDHYIVRAGDTLEKIARQARVSVESLKKRNNLSSDHIITGQKLYLPQ